MKKKKEQKDNTQSIAMIGMGIILSLIDTQIHMGLMFMGGMLFGIGLAKIR